MVTNRLSSPTLQRHARPVQTALYRGDAEGAWQLITSHWPLLRRTWLLRVQIFRIEAWFLRGGARSRWRPAERTIAAFSRRRAMTPDGSPPEAMPWSNPLALLLSAGVAVLEGDPALARRRLSDAVDGFERADMGFYAAVARRRLAALQEGPTAPDRASRDDWMAGTAGEEPASFVPGVCVRLHRLGAFCSCRSVRLQPDRDRVRT